MGVTMNQPRNAPWPNYAPLRKIYIACVCACAICNKSTQISEIAQATNFKPNNYEQAQNCSLKKEN